MKTADFFNKDPSLEDIQNRTTIQLKVMVNRPKTKPSSLNNSIDAYNQAILGE